MNGTRLLISYSLLNHQKCYLSGECGAEHDDLFVRPAVVDDPHDLRFESHVEQPIGFIQNEIGDPAKVGDSAGVCCQHVDHAAGRADEDLGSALQFGDLLRNASSSVNTHGSKNKFNLNLNRANMYIQLRLVRLQKFRSI